MPSRLSDELLARFAARGSARAFSAIYDRYHQPLYRYCRSILRNEADAQDALQGTFAGALSALRRDRRNAPLRPWLFRIAHNEAISILRTRVRDGERHRSSIGATAAASAEERVAERARWAVLVSDIAGLPARQRTALVLRELSGLSHEEIALVLDTSAGGAKQAIFEARQALAELEEGRAMSCEDVRRRLSDGDRRVVRGRRVRAHLGACSGCAAFAAAIPSRRAELRACMPVLPAASAAALLTGSVRAGSAPGGAGGTSGVSAATTATAGAAGKLTAAAIASKALVGAAILATTAASVTGVVGVLDRHHGSAPKLPVHAHGGVAAAGGVTRGPAGRRGTNSTLAPSRAPGGNRSHANAAGAAGSRRSAVSGPSTTAAPGSQGASTSASHRPSGAAGARGASPPGGGAGPSASRPSAAGSSQGNGNGHRQGGGPTATAGPPSSPASGSSHATVPVVPTPPVTTALPGPPTGPAHGGGPHRS